MRTNFALAVEHLHALVRI